MRNLSRKQINIILIAIIVVLLIITAGVGIALAVKSKENKEVVYEDKIVCKNYFEKITIDLSEKEVKRDTIETTLQEEFGISKEEEEQLLNSQDMLQNYFADTTFNVEIKDNVATITNLYQTKKIIVKSANLSDTFGAINVEKYENGLYVLEYDTRK